ncbi:MAG: ABC transporter permease [Gemmatimonas sp.]
MFPQLFAFELRGHFRRPVTWLYVAILFALAFFAISTDAVLVVDGLGKVKKNSPFAIAQLFGILLAIGQVITGALVSSAILRDFEDGVHELVFTTRVTRVGYLAAKFLAAFLAMLLVFAAVPVGALAGSFAPWAEQSSLQPIVLWYYIQPWLVIGIPGVFFLSATLFAVGALTRSAFAGYVTGILLLVGLSVGQALTRTLDNDTLANLVDPFAIRTFNLVTRYWTPAEKNTLVLPWSGFLSANRLLWAGVGAVLLLVAFRLVRLEKSAGLGRRRRVKAAVTTATVLPHGTPASARPAIARRTSFRAPSLLAGWSSVMKFHTVSLLRSVPFLAIATIGLINVFMGAWYADQSGETRTWPMSWLMANAAVGGAGLFMIVLLTFYVGELVWRERQVKLDQVLDSSPVRTASILVGKFTAMVLLLLAFATTGMLAGMFVQVVKGFAVINLKPYLLHIYVVDYPSWFAMVAMAFLVQSLVPRKAIGHVVMILIYFSSIVLSNFGWGYKLLMLGDAPVYVWSDMNGAGPYPMGFLPVHGYWLSISLVLLGLTYLAWQRGTERLRAQWRARFTTGTRAVLAGGAIGAGAFGGIFYYNASVLNHFRSRTEGEKRAVAYEHAWRKYEALTLPKVVAVSLQVDLEPENLRARTAGTLTMVNKSGRPIDTMYVDVPSSASTMHVALDSLSFGRPVHDLVGDAGYGIRIVRLDSALAPNDTLRVRFVQRWESRGIANGGSDTRIAYNGTFLNRGEFPALGYQADDELSSDELRKKYKLPEARRGHARTDSAYVNRQEFSQHSDFITFDATVSTAPDQIALAPGYKEREWTANGRRYFHYVMNAPIPDFYSVLSARWDVTRDTWNGIPIEIYHHPDHTFNVKRMIAASKAALELYSRDFGAYQHQQLRILEFPRYAGFAQSFPNTVPYSEGIGFVARVDSTDVEDTDLPYFVTSHEIAHQWFPYQRMSGDVEGKDMLSESFSEYAALVVSEHLHGRPFTQKFLRAELDSYLRGRANEKKAEHPLTRTYGQAYIHYQKGSLALFALRDLLGERVLHGAIKAYQDERRFMGPPYGTTLDFMRQLRAVTPDSLHYALEDYLETITLWDVKTDSITSTKQSDGQYKVVITATARKMRADSLGTETEVAMNDLVDVGVFAEAKRGTRIGEPISIRKVRVKTGTARYEFVVPTKPARAGIDPYNLLIDRSPGDNTREVPDK